jgi:cytidylate kinase
MQLIEALSEIAQGVDQPIIAIDGPAGAGKTTLASTIFLARQSFIWMSSTRVGRMQSEKS